MSVETMEARIRKEAKPCAACGGSDFSLVGIDNKNAINSKPREMYFLQCKNCPHKRLEIDYDQAEENEKIG